MFHVNQTNFLLGVMMIVDCYFFNSVSTRGDVALIFGCSSYLSFKHLGKVVGEEVQ